MSQRMRKYCQTVRHPFSSKASREIAPFFLRKWRDLSIWTLKCSRVLSPWAEEMAYSLISCALMITLVVILDIFDNRPLSDWQGAVSVGSYSVNISLNFIVAVLGTISKSAVLVSIEAGLSQAKWIWFTLRKHSLLDYKRFDDASRGPLGSIKLLLAVTNIRNFASFGALLIIMGLVFDPFLQLLVSYQNLLSDFPSAHVSLARSTVYDGGNDTPSGLNLTDSYGNVFQRVHVGLHIDMDAAITQALDSGNNTSVPQPTYNCSTSNCTWPPFTSLAVCSRCTDISSHIQTTFIQNTTFIDNTHTAFHSPSLRHSLLINPSQGSLPSEFVNGDFLNQFPYPILENPIGMRLDFSNYSSRILSTHTTAEPNNTFTFSNSSNLLFSIQTLYSTMSYIENKNDWNSTQVDATECAVYLCTNTYTSAVVNGTLVESVSATASLRIPNSYSPIPDQLTKNSSDRSLNPLSITNFSDPLFNSSSSAPVFQPYYVSRTNLSLSAPPGMSGMFNVTQGTLEGMIEALLDGFAGFTNNESNPASLPANATNTWSGFSTNQRGMSIQSLATLEADGTVLLENNAKAVSAVAGMLFHGPHTKNASAGLDALDRYFDNLASSMTSVIRNDGDPALFQAGAAQQWAVYIQVRWGVLAVPVFFVVSSLIFLAICIWRTNSLGLYPWKENPLPGLITGLEGEARIMAKVKLEEEGWGEKTFDKISRDMQVMLRDQQRPELLV